MTLITCVAFIIVLPAVMLTLATEQRKRRLLVWIPPLVILLSILVVFAPLLGPDPQRTAFLLSVETLVSVARMAIPFYIFTAIYDDGSWRSMPHNPTF